MCFIACRCVFKRDFKTQQKTKQKGEFQILVIDIVTKKKVNLHE